MNIEEIPSKAVKISVQDGDNEAGWVLLYIIGRELCDKQYGFVEDLYVREEYRRQGHARKLIEALRGEAKKRGCYKIVACSRHGKEHVHTLFEQCGFVDHGKEFRLDLA